MTTTVSSTVIKKSSGCFWGEEQSTWDHDNDGIVNWADDDWDGDGISNTVELGALPYDFVAPFDHDNDGTRDDIDEDDDQDGMHDIDEVMLWPERFNRNSTNPWDHDDYGNGEALANPNDPDDWTLTSTIPMTTMTLEMISITTSLKKALLPTLVTRRLVL